MRLCIFCGQPIKKEESEMLRKHAKDLNPNLPVHIICALQTKVMCADCGLWLLYCKSKYSEAFPLEIVCAECAERNEI